MSVENPGTNPATAAEPTAQPAVPARPQVTIDDSKAGNSYVNFCRVTGTPEELIIDFAVNPQPHGRPTKPIQLNERVVTNYYTAKRLIYALQRAVAMHEKAFGVVETNVERRLRRPEQ